MLAYMSEWPSMFAVARRDISCRAGIAVLSGLKRTWKDALSSWRVTRLTHGMIFRINTGQRVHTTLYGVGARTVGNTSGGIRGQACTHPRGSSRMETLRALWTEAGLEAGERLIRSVPLNTMWMSLMTKRRT